MFRDYIIPPLTSESNIRTLIIIVVIQGMAKMLRDHRSRPGHGKCHKADSQDKSVAQKQ